MTTAVDVDTTTGTLLRIPIADLHDSPLNPRRHFDQAALDELASSLRIAGQLTPVLARPRPAGGYELAAGHRRRRAAPLADLTHLDAVVRDMDDATFVEALNVENLQRDDLHPLEEADGFRSLMITCGYDVARLAERCGRSPRYVYDRLSLLELTAEAQTLFRAGTIPTAHAIELARLGTADQARALGSDRSGNGRIGGLFVPDHGQHEIEVDAEPGDAPEPRKPVSLGEFRRWIADTVRFNPADHHLPELFPETAATLAAAAEQELKIVKITREYRVADEAKDPHERTYGTAAWKRADGIKSEPPTYGRTEPKPATCAYSVLGVVVAGQGRGDAFAVCIAKKTCKVHWAREMKEAASRKAGVAKAAATPHRRPSWEIEQERRERENARWWAVRAELAIAMKAAIAAADMSPAGPILGIVLERRLHLSKKERQVITGAGSLGAALCLVVTMEVDAAVAYGGSIAESAGDLCKALGVDAKKILAAKAKREKAAPQALDEQTAACEQCGCTWDAACEAGCSWNQTAWKKGTAICSACDWPAKATKSKKARRAKKATTTGVPE